MDPSLQVKGEGTETFQVLWQDGERALCRQRSNPDQTAVLVVVPATEYPSPASLERLAHSFSLKDELDAAWALRPLALKRERGRTILVLEDPGGEPLARRLGSPLEIGQFLSLAIGIATALGQLHQRGLIHKDLKPAHILVGCPDGQVRLTGFGIASRLARERQTPEPPETIAGTLAYMAPEQTGRMNRSIDSRSDLYALGVIFYEMLTGTLPFVAADPMEWIHCHIARQPDPPNLRNAAVPAQLSAIVLKLLAKTADDRYQTAAGLIADLRRCLDEWKAVGRVQPFPLGTQDASDRLLIPEHLYGRENEIETLIATFDRVAANGAVELVLVSGYSGIGKSSVVNELHKVLIPPRGMFAAGKFDQYKRDIPYATLTQAFQGLVRPLLAKSDVELATWRDALIEALAPNARLMTDLIPELRLIIGEQPPVPELEPQQAQHRFQLVFRRFIAVFAQPEHPLALFLDDLQWLDAATLDLLEDVLTRGDLHNLMLIGAYRDNEVDAAHPLRRRLEAIKRAGGRIHELALAPLARRHIERLLAHTLHCEAQHATPLAELVYEKTEGNPFFVMQFLSSLFEEGLLWFDHAGSRWSWNLELIHAKRYTDNVVDLMVAKLARLPAETQQALPQLACLGNVAEAAILTVVLQMSEEQVHAALWSAVRQQLIERQDNRYRFIHDRVQEAAYSLIPAAQRAQVHLRIGRLLVARIPAATLDEAIFEIVNQLNRGAKLMTAREEREQLAEYNLRAALRAKSSVAYASALSYLAAGRQLLGGDAWERRHELCFALAMNQAECEFLTGQLPAAEQHLLTLSERATTAVEQASVACLQLDVYTFLDQNSRAVDVCLDYLRGVGITWTAAPTDGEVQAEYERIWTTLGERSIETLIDLPLMTDPASLATAEVLSKLFSTAAFTAPNLASLTICKAISLSLERGVCDASCLSYVLLGRIAGPRFNNYEAGWRFGQLGYQFVERRGLKRFEASTFLCFSIFVIGWMRHIRTASDLVRRAFEVANRVGDLTYGAYTRNILASDLLFAGEALPDAQREIEQGLEYARNAQFPLVVEFLTTQLALVRTLRGVTPTFGSFNDVEYDEHLTEKRFGTNPELGIAACFYWIRKLQARYLAGDYATALHAATNAYQLLSTTSSLIEEAEYHFYSGLAHVARCDTVSGSDREAYIAAIRLHHVQLQKWAEIGPDNFEHRAALLGAELARISGDDADAMRGYELALRSARQNGFIHNEALTHELASRFYAARGFDNFAQLYWRNARSGYQQWGAEGKVRHLEAMYPHLRAEEPAPATTIAAPVEHLDLSTVIKVSQAVSGEIVLDKLLETLVRTALEQAGAERGVLILTHGAEQHVAAEATTRGDQVSVCLRDEPVSPDRLPGAVLHYALRTRESVVLDDAAQSSFAADAYIRQHQVRSVLCLPLLNQAKVIGLLYLENNLTPRVFAPARIPVLKLLASQAAVSLENTRLYKDLAEREARIRRLVDADVIGIVIWDLDGRLLDANDAFLRMVQYTREDVAAGMRWFDMTPPEWQEAHVLEEAEELKTTGMMKAREKEFFRRDGSRVPVLIGAACFDEPPDQGVAYILDLSERKRAEAEARESERRYREVQLELAHANRVTTMGQLTGSIAHEVNQPIAATVISAQAALRWLGRQPPDLDEVRQLLAQIVKNGARAGEVIHRIRALIKKAPAQQDVLAINGPIREVIELTRTEAMKSRVSVTAELAENLPLICGDRVQLQQVMLNLIVNAIEALSGVHEGAREVVIRTEQDGAGDVLVSVRDTGPGLDAQGIEQVFEAFYTTKASGMGMGLSICRSIIEAHGGRLWASPNEPRGARLQFTLPPWQEDVAAENRASRPAARHRHLNGLS
ncbi:AAA family ATPase (plasmid) [Microvirga terrae]|uniref:histidine kinase n=1 Tax=Microvirga terrae TaxID=2740529 RepID=A0ABY5S287_9HYPH|nr:trifunctional serine/threonine-protein kinase/ATP-binding protein/sensor histidine kinase [Microvirga terrae]UVF22527.1 AAA family ATPase [Microvirga terrae]